MFLSGLAGKLLPAAVETQCPPKIASAPHYQGLTPSPSPRVGLLAAAQLKCEKQGVGI